MRKSKIKVKLFAWFRPLLIFISALLGFALTSFAQLTTITTPDVFICVPDTVQLTTTPSGGTSYSYSWSPTTGLSSSTISNPIATPVVTTTYIVTVTDIPTSNTIRDTVTITIQNIPPPLTITPQNDTICAGDTLNLDVVNGPACQTVTGTCQSPSSFKRIGLSNFLAFTANDNPFYKANNFFAQARSTKHQYIYTVAELNSRGFFGPTTISGISWRLVVNFGSFTYNNVELKMACTSDTVLTSTFKTGLTTVYNPKSLTFSSTQWKFFSFYKPYVWDGESNIVLEVCFANSSASNGMPWVRYSTYTNNIAAYTSANSNVCSNTSGSLTNRRPNTRFYKCAIVHDSPLSYSWSPAGGLSNTNIKNPLASPTSTTSYVLTATDNNGCIILDTTTISVAPSFNLSLNNDTTLCNSDTINIFAAHNGGSGALIKWSSSSWIENDTLPQTRGYFTASDKVSVEVSSLAGCTKSDSFLVNIVPPVEATILTNDTTICAGDSLPIIVSTNSMACVTYSNIACQNPSNLTFSSSSAFPSGGTIISPFDALFTLTNPGQKKQYIIQASELATLSNSTTLSKLGFNIQNVGSSNTTRTGFTIKIGCTSINAFPFGSSNFVTGLQTVFTPKTINIGTGWNDFVFDNAFVWDGVSNIIVEICWQNSSSLGFGFTTLYWSTTSFRSVLLNWNNSNFCTATSGNFSSTFRPEMRFENCSSPPNPAYDFLWTPNTGLSSDTIAEPIIFPSLTTNFRLTVTDPTSGCSDTDSLLISVAPNFNTSVTNDTTLCIPDSVLLSVTHNSTNSVTYNWQPSSAVSDSSVSNPWIYVDGMKTIVSEVKSNLGCIKWDTIYMGLYDRIDVSIVAPTGINCEGDSVQFNSKTNLACGQSNSPLCNPANTLTIGTSTVTSSLFNVTPFDGSNKSSKKQYLIRKSELNTAGMTGSSQLSSLSFEITALGKTDYQNFSIKMTCTSVNSLGTSFNNSTVTVFDPKSITLINGKNWFNFDSRFNWDGESNIIVEVCYNNFISGSNSEIYYTLPTPQYNCTVYARGNSVCNNGIGTSYNRRPNIEFKYCSVTTSAYIYNWSPSNWYSDPGIPNPMARVSVPGWYKLSLTDPNSNCITEDSVELNVISFNLEALEDTSLCSTEGYQLGSNTNAVLPKYKWTPANEVSNDTIKNPVIIINNGVNYILEVTDSAGCIKRDTVDIILLPRPTASAIPNNVDMCRFKDLQLQGSGGLIYEWTPAAGLSDPNISSPVANVSDSTVFYLTVTNVEGCTDVDSVVINIFPSPILDLGPDTSYCNGGWIALNADPDFINYLWQDNSKQSSYLVESNGVYWVRVNDQYNCVFSDTVIIAVAPAPVTNIDYMTDVCSSDSAILDALNPGSTYLWSTGETNQSIIVKDSGFYRVEIDNGRCIGSDSTIVTIYDYPISSLEELAYYCEKEYPFGMTLTAGSEEYRYKWNNGQVTNSIIVTAEGTYSVVITNGDKCSINRTTDVVQLCSEIIFVPNSFTPNSDLKNDVFSITALNLDEFEFRIFNRWGELIYFTTNPEFEWAGDHDGNFVENGVYVWRMDYKIKVADGSYEKREVNGSITLLR